MTKIYLIKDADGIVCGIAPTEVEARKQVMWFLPKKEYFIFLDWIS